MTLSDQAIGWISVTGAIIFFGIYAIPVKIGQRKQKVDPLLFQFYFSMSLLPTSLLTLIYAHTYTFNYWALIGSLLYVPLNTLSIFAINSLGLSIAIG